MEVMNNLSRDTLFYYVCLFIFIIYIFSNIKIGLNIVFGTMVAIILLGCLYTNKIKETKQHNEIEEREKKGIIPQPMINDHEEIIDYLFSIQDFYAYNPMSYSSCVSEINNFFALYDETEDDNSLAGKNFEEMKIHKRNAMNSLNEISYKLEPNVEYDKKLQNAITNLEQILNYHLMHIYKIHQEYTYKHGTTTKTKFIEKNELLPYNTYDDKLYTKSLV